MPGSHLHPNRLATLPTRIGAKNPPTLLEAVQTPHTVPRSVSDHQVVMMRAQAGAPRPCSHDLLICSLASNQIGWALAPWSLLIFRVLVGSVHEEEALREGPSFITAPGEVRWCPRGCRTRGRRCWHQMQY